MKRDGPSRFIARLIVAVVAIVSTLLVAEVYLRVFKIKPERYPHPRWAVRHGADFSECNIWGNGLIKRPSRFAEQGVVMGEYVPDTVFKCLYASNSRGYFDADGGVEMSVDNLGMRSRGVATPMEKAPDIFRILCLGDSFTFGVGVRDGDTFCRKLEERLNTVWQGRRKVEVLNAGVQGYNTRDEVLYLEQQWLAYKPDLVLIVFYVNDAYSDNTILNNGEALGIYLEPESRLARMLRVWDCVAHGLQARKVRRGIEQFYRERYFSEPAQFLDNPGDVHVDWSDSRAALGRAAELSRAQGFALGLVIFPELYRLDAQDPFLPIYRLVEGTAVADGIPCLNLFNTYRGRDPKTLWVHPSDHHPNEVAHGLAAEAMTDFVRQVVPAAP